MIDFFMSLLRPIQHVVAWIMVRFHELFTALGMDADGGPTWALSIIGLVIVIRIVLIPLFVKQIKAMRGMQVIQPEMRKIQQKYKGKTDPASRQAMQQEMMALYRESGTNPMASCLPLLLQSPIFLALFYTLNGIKDGNGIGALTDQLAAQARDATLFGAPLSATFWGDKSDPATAILTIAMIVLMSASQFITQKQLMAKNTSSAMDESNPFAQQQKMMLYLLPVIFAISGVHFPIGVLLYWLTTNLWSMGQQFYVIRRMPSPGSLAEKELEARRARKAARRGTPLSLSKDAPAAGGDAAPAADGSSNGQPVRRSGQRQQPRRNDRNRRTRPGTPPASGGRTR
ncbi:membrane protein insertase YidC [Kineococcus glutinatus]|uniref:Membrane protein insertase YidC n=1 Tax=Kineococcus glutinatus TaxID=1070872 RepID=A0ABP9H6X1_9ACTN